jgi:hypothetical protein
MKPLVRLVFDISVPDDCDIRAAAIRVFGPAISARHKELVAQFEEWLNAFDETQGATVRFWRSGYGEF